MRSPKEDALRENQQAQQPVLVGQQLGESRNEDRRTSSIQSRPHSRTPKYLIDEREWIRQFGY